MTSIRFLFILSFVCAFSVVNVHGHGRLLVPPARGTLWREPQFSAIGVKNYDDMGLNCGGWAAQWQSNKGKCGICGDRYDGSRPHEGPNGKYAQKIIVRSYTEGGIMDVKVQLTAIHKGWFEFRICKEDDLQKEATQQCLDQNVLSRVGKQFTRVIVRDGVHFYNVRLHLPPGLTCKRCVFQWKYHTGNNWGVDPITGRSCRGCGPAQEEFYGCADVKITPAGGGGGGGGSVRTTPKPTTPKLTTRKPTTIKPTQPKPECKGTGILRYSPEVARRCKLTCARGCCPVELCNDACRMP